MARLVLPLDAQQRAEFEDLSQRTGLKVAVLLDLWRRGFRVVPAEAGAASDHASAKTSHAEAERAAGATGGEADP